MANYVVYAWIVSVAITMSSPIRHLPSVDQPGNSDETPFTYLALGDSYTIGESIPESGRWSVQLVSLLEEQEKKVTLDIIARTGWTTAELSSAIASGGNRKSYSMVSLLIGVNNQYRGLPLEDYRREFAALLNTAVAFAHHNPAHVFVLSIPDWGATPYAENRDRNKIANEIDAFNAVAQEECEKHSIVFVDITGLSRTAATDLSLVAGDSLHFSAAMYRMWALKALPVAKQILK